ncbi:MAG TPA: hypothetical protein VG518_03045, partial [Solirubrobacterales bacterium]|nr:hypothetical protein [Solirubrobacterales bacterium]
MPGPGAAAGAKAAGAAAGRVGGSAGAGAASRSGAAKAAKSRGGAAAGRAGAAKRGGGKGAKSVGRLIAFRVRRKRGGGGEPELFGSGFTKFLGVAGVCLMCFILVVIAPLLIFEASASGCGEEEGGGGDEAVPIQTNHQTEPEDMSETQVAIRIYLVGQVMHMTPRQIVGAYATGYVETHMQNLHWATEGSRGVFMQRGFSPWTDGGRNRLNVIDASISFFLRMRELDHGQPIGELDWQVQQPAEQYRYRYALWVDEGIEMYEKVHRLLGTAKGVKSIESLQGVTISS